MFIFGKQYMGIMGSMLMILASLSSCERLTSFLEGRFKFSEVSSGIVTACNQSES